MTPQEKAKELVDKFSEYASDEGIQSGDKNLCAKECALIAVEEILKEITDIEYAYITVYGALKEYWKDVKQEIEKL